MVAILGLGRNVGGEAKERERVYQTDSVAAAKAGLATREKRAGKVRDDREVEVKGVLAYHLKLVVRLLSNSSA